jgi:hypothetical protein
MTSTMASTKHGRLPALSPSTGSQQSRGCSNSNQQVWLQQHDSSSTVGQRHMPLQPLGTQAIS